MTRPRAALRRLGLLVLLGVALCTAALASRAPENTALLETALREALPARQETIELPSAGLEAYRDGTLVVDLLRQMAAQSPDAPEESLDYDVLNIRAIYTRVEDGTLYISIEYLTTQEQETAVDAACAQIRAELALDGQTALARVRRLYEYVGTHFVYDQSRTIFSAYDGLQRGEMVCQGYAILLYKLLWQENIPNRIVTGYAGGVAHGWNIVQLGDVWYSLDVTWDTCKTAGEAMSWNWFLHGGTFEEHTRAAGYQTGVFVQAHPMAKADYPLARVRVQIVNGGSFSSLMLRRQIAVQVVCSVPEREELTFTLDSTDTAVVCVSQDGTLLAKQVGTCSVFIRADDPEVIPAMIPVTAVDLTGASDWAQASVDLFYLSGGLPAEQCQTFQEVLTRGEFAQLVYPIVTQLPRSTLKTMPYAYDDTLNAENGDYLEYLAALGLLHGSGDGRLTPEAALTREQAAVILMRLCALLGAPAPEDAAQTAWLDRASIADWAQSACDRICAAGVLRGVGQGQFAPRAGLTREQAICALCRVLIWCRPTA